MLPDPVTVAPGILWWRNVFDPGAQQALVLKVFDLVREAPFYRPRMPVSGTPFSVEETNFGSLGWISDERGYRYSTTHPQTEKLWPAIPAQLLDLWAAATGYPGVPECCLVNLYRGDARMGLHQDRDEQALDAPVLSVSLGDSAIFRIGGTTRRGPTKSVRLQSGDIIQFGGAARLAYHGIDRIICGTSDLLPGGGRLNLTLRRVNPPPETQDARSGG